MTRSRTNRKPGRRDSKPPQSHRPPVAQHQKEHNPFRWFTKFSSNISYIRDRSSGVDMLGRFLSAR